MKKNELKSNIPENPGVYLFKNSMRKIIYIGKASNLRKRVSSYFTTRALHNERTARMLSRAKNIDFIVTQSEVDALVLEETLIKLHKPQYNVKLTDDKKYPYIKVTFNETFPRIFPTRIVKKDGALYLGPYTDVKAVKKTIKTGRRIFPTRNCGKKLPQKECLDYHIGLCSAPCISAITKEEYRTIVQDSVKFLEGRHNKLEKQLDKSMKEHSSNLEFEKAANIRDRLSALRKVQNRQKVVLSKAADIDVIGLAEKQDNFCIVVDEIRNGKLVSQHHYFMNGISSLNDVMETFLSTYYRDRTYIPKEIILEASPVNKLLVQKWLSKKAKCAVTLKENVRKEKLSLLKMANKNAKIFIADFVEKKRKKSISKDIIELAKVLNLKTPPQRIEAFDISNIMGKFAVGSSVLFVNGKPLKSGYLHYRIKSVNEINDVAMIKEVIERKLRRIMQDKDKIPNLFVVDGGEGQLNAAISVLKHNHIHIHAIGLAKKFEDIHIGKNRIVSLPVDSPALKLLRRIRDEAHRFAISYYRKLHNKSLRKSALDDIKGIGKLKKKYLLKHFGSVSKLKQASIQEIEQVQGFGSKTASVIFEYLRNSPRKNTVEKT